MERRLAAILSADVVGYSRLMEADEEATIRELSACRQIIDGLVANHHGRVFGSAGDSVIAEFTSAVEAVPCPPLLSNAAFPSRTQCRQKPLKESGSNERIPLLPQKAAEGGLRPLPRL